MALSFREVRTDGSDTVHTFAAVDIGAPQQNRKVLVAWALFGTNSPPSITVNGIDASSANSHSRTSNVHGLSIAAVPEGETAEIVVTHPFAGSCAIAVWRVGGMTSTDVVDAHNFPLLYGIDHEIETAAGGFVIGLQIRTGGDPGWGGLDAQFVQGSFSGAHAAPTDGTPLHVTGTPRVNINSGYTLTSFATGGLDEDGPGGSPEGIYDANPAHIIRACYTDTDWGMGGAPASLDDDAFRAAALTLYNEQLGLSLQWVEQTDIESFIQEIIDHIEAQIFIHPRTGLVTLKLIRGDYTIAGLPTISPANATLTNWARKGWGETVNEIVVSWTNPRTEKAETVTMQDLAGIAAQGGIVSETRNYYGVRRRALARQLAHRDLRAASSPLATCDAVLDRSQWELVPGDVVKLNWPEYGIEQTIMRVGPVDYGAPSSSQIKVSLVEDVFGRNRGEFFAPPDSDWVDQREEPSAIDHHEVLTLPYWSIVKVIGAAGASDAAHPESAAGVLAAHGGADTEQYDLETLVTDASGVTTYQRVATRSTLARMEAVAAIGAEAETVLTLAGLTQGALPQTGGFAFIGAGGDAGVEIALVTAFDDVTEDVTLARGVLDTVPRAWPALTPVWFLNADQPWHDPTERAAGETASYKIRTLTSLGILARAAAPVIEFTVGERPYLPSRPANVKVNGVGFGEVDSTTTDPVTVTVAERNRLTEDSQVLGWTDATVTPESGQTWKVELLHPVERTVIATVSGLTGTSTTIAHSVFAGNTAAILRVTADRDGFESLQGHEMLVVVTDVAFTADTDVYTADADAPTADYG